MFELAGKIQQAAFSNDGKSVALSLVDSGGFQTLVVAADGSVFRRLPVDRPSGLAFSPDSKSLAYSLPAAEASPDGAIAVIDLESGTARVIEKGGQPASLAWVDNGALAYADKRRGLHQIAGYRDR